MKLIERIACFAGFHAWRTFVRGGLFFVRCDRCGKETLA